MPLQRKASGEIEHHLTLSPSRSDTLLRVSRHGGSDPLPPGSPYGESSSSGSGQGGSGASSSACSQPGGHCSKPSSGGGKGAPLVVTPPASQSAPPSTARTPNAYSPPALGVPSSSRNPFGRGSRLKAASTPLGMTVADPKIPVLVNMFGRGRAAANPPSFESSLKATPPLMRLSPLLTLHGTSLPMGDPHALMALLGRGGGQPARPARGHNNAPGAAPAAALPAPPGRRPGPPKGPSKSPLAPTT